MIIDFSNYSAGMYLVKILFENSEVENHKIIVK